MYFIVLHLAGDELIWVNSEHIISFREFHLAPDDATINSVVLLTSGEEIQVIETCGQIMDLIP
jgi:hypothetical protein